MSVVVVTGSSGLIGSEGALFYLRQGYQVVGIDNNMRQYFFGQEGSTLWNQERLKKIGKDKYIHYNLDIRDFVQINKLFKKYENDISLIIHTAAQPSHDWAAKEPLTDFTVNANGTLNLLTAMERNCSQAVFIFISTNKVYGDRPNELPLVELDTRWEIEEKHPYYQGIPEEMNIDQCLHSLFGASKLAADILVQEFGRYFNLKTCCFRGGVLSGPWQAGVPLHGFLNYLMKCVMTGTPYTIMGYQGKQVRDVIASCDVISAIDAFYQAPREGGQVYNLGGGRASNISILEAIDLAQEITGKKLNYHYSDKNRRGDHIWYITDLHKFTAHYPQWKITKDVPMIMQEIYEENKNRWPST